ncbi:MAG: hypothetical protein HXY21_06325 [Parvularculaceae bacterium]|nr:hypothetical protein [Parvularculaceae bacterium]
MKRAAFVAAVARIFIGAAVAEDYRAEGELLAREIVDIHPRGQEIAASPEYIAAKAALLEEAADTDLPHYAIALGRLFHAANDGHTAAIPLYGEAPEFKFRYPLKLKRFDDGLYVVAAKGAAEKLLGARLTAIGGRKIDALLRDFVGAQAAGNRAWPANWTAVGMTVPGFLIGLDAAASLEAPVRVEAVRKGRRLSAMLAASAEGHEGLVDLQRPAPPLASLGGGATNFAAEIADGRALAIVIGAMEDAEKKSFETFTAEASAAIAATKADRVIIDLRDNGGGNNMLAEPLRRTLVKSRFNRAGGLYVLTSPATFSAAQNFATRLERETDALFVGEPTGGSPNHFGDAKFAHAPTSGIPYIISTLRWQDSPPFDERPWILPDIPAPPDFGDFLAGRDAALELALAHQAEPVSGDWRMRVVQPWKRDSQTKDWRFFFEPK